MKRFLSPAAGVAIGCLALVGCARTVPATAVTPALVVPPAPKSPDEAVAELETAYIGALELAASYAQLPRCGAGAPSVCSSPPLIAALLKDKPAASAALDEARAAVKAYDALSLPGTADIAAAEAAIAAATSIVRGFTADANATKGS